MTAFLNADRLAKDIAKINDGARSKKISVLGVTPWRSFAITTPTKLPRTSSWVISSPNSTSASACRRRITARSPGTAPWPTSRSAGATGWNFLFIAGMWFQDLFNYDFRRTEQCITPYATQEGRDFLLRV